MRDSYLSTCAHFTSVEFSQIIEQRENDAKFCNNYYQKCTHDTQSSSFRDSFWFRLHVIRADGRCKHILFSAPGKACRVFPEVLIQ